MCGGGSGGGGNPQIDFARNLGDRIVDIRKAEGEERDPYDKLPERGAMAQEDKASDILNRDQLLALGLDPKATLPPGFRDWFFKYGPGANLPDKSPGWTSQNLPDVSKYPFNQKFPKITEPLTHEQRLEMPLLAKTGWKAVPTLIKSLAGQLLLALAMFGVYVAVTKGLEALGVNVKGKVLLPGGQGTKEILANAAMIYYDKQALENLDAYAKGEAKGPLRIDQRSDRQVRDIGNKLGGLLIDRGLPQVQQNTVAYLESRYGVTKSDIKTIMGLNESEYQDMIKHSSKHTKSDPNPAGDDDDIDQ